VLPVSFVSVVVVVVVVAFVDKHVSMTCTAVPKSCLAF
jgi:hypothetical protein